MMTDEEIKTYLARCNKIDASAIPGPWEWRTDDNGYGIWASNGDGGHGCWVINDYSLCLADGDLCIVARDLLPRVLSELAEAQENVKKLMQAK